MPRTIKSRTEAPKRSKHEGMLDQMRSALYALSEQIREAEPAEGDALLPEALRGRDDPKSRAAKKFIEHVHRGFKKRGY